MNEHELMDQIYEHFAKLPTMRKSSAVIYDQMMGFYHAVSWSKDVWLFGIFAFHLALLLLVVLARRFYYLQVFIFAYGCTSIFLLERANALLREHWRAFSTQNYFDEHGVFLSVVFATPMLCILSIQLLLTLRDAARLVVTVKRHELKQKQREKKE